MRVIVADDQPDVRSALRLMLEEKSDIDMIAEVRTSTELMRQVKSGCPDLILLDWELPGIKPGELLILLKTLCPHLMVIALSSRPQMRQNALAAGANSFVCKSDPPELLLTALNRCYRSG